MENVSEMLPIFDIFQVIQIEWAFKNIWMLKFNNKVFIPQIQSRIQSRFLTSTYLLQECTIQHMASTDYLL